MRSTLYINSFLLIDSGRLFLISISRNWLTINKILLIEIYRVHELFLTWIRQYLARNRNYCIQFGKFFQIYEAIQLSGKIISIIIITWNICYWYWRCPTSQLKMWRHCIENMGYWRVNVMAAPVFSKCHASANLETPCSKPIADSWRHEATHRIRLLFSLLFFLYFYLLLHGHVYL